MPICFQMTSAHKGFLSRARFPMSPVSSATLPGVYDRLRILKQYADSTINQLQVVVPFDVWRQAWGFHPIV